MVTKRNAESLLKNFKIMGDGPRVIGMVGPRDEQKAQKSSRNSEMASSDGQHATPEQHVEHAQDDYPKGKATGG